MSKPKLRQMTRHVTLEEAESFVHDHERGIKLQRALNKLVDERGYFTFSDVKYHSVFED